MEPLEYIVRICAIILFVAFIPFSMVSYLRWQLPDKQKRFLDIIEKCNWNKPPSEAAWIPYSLLAELGDEISDGHVVNKDEILEKARIAARRDYILPILFASLTVLLGSIVLLFGPTLLGLSFDENARIDLILSGSFKESVLCSATNNSTIDACKENVKLLQTLQVSAIAFVGAYIWSIMYVMRRLNVIDLDSNVYYNIGIRIILSNFIAIIFFLAFRDGILDQHSEFIPALAFFIGWFPRRFFCFLKDNIFRLFSMNSKEAHQFPMEMIQGMKIFHRTRLSEAGIDDAQNLANANLLEMLIRTPFNPRLLVDWIAQAKLYVLFRDKVVTLRAARIRTIFDFCKIMDNAKSQSNLISVINTLSKDKKAASRGLKLITKDELLVAWETIKDDKDIKWLTDAKCCLLGFKK